MLLVGTKADHVAYIYVKKYLYVPYRVWLRGIWKLGVNELFVLCIVCHRFARSN